MDSLSLRQLKGLLQLKLRLLMRFWAQRDQMYRWTLFLSFFLSGVLAFALAGAIFFVIYLPLPPEQRSEMTYILPYLWLTLFLAVGVMWLISPLLFMMKNESLTLDISRLTRFPVRYRMLQSFHTLLAFLEPWNLFFYPLTIAVGVAIVLQTGIGLLLPTLLLLGIWVLVHIVWSRLIQDLLSFLFTNRYFKESLSLGLLLLIILVSFIPALISERSALEALRQINAPNLELFLLQWPTWQSLFPILDFLAASTPAGWFTHALQGLLNADWRAWLWGCGVLLAWLSLGDILGTVLLRQLFLEAPVAQSPELRQRRARFRLTLLPWIPDDLRVLALKELRSYFRSMLGKLSFCLTPLLVAILSFVGLNQAHIPTPTLILGMSAYIFMTSLFLYINYFGPDGEGFKLYLLSGISERRILLAKNLGLGLFASGQFGLVLLIYVVLYDSLSTPMLIFALCSFASLLLVVLSIGNVLSLRFPTAMDLNQTQYRSSNGTPIVLALQILMVAVSLIGAPVWLHYWFHEPLWLLAMMLTGLILLAWWLILNLAESIFKSCRFEVLEAVTQRE